jgi:hypothetical protein
MIPVIDGEGEVRGHGSHEDFGRLDAALDFESTGRRVTAQKALHLMVRGSHVSGFILRPDDGLSDVAIVCNGAVRWLTPAEFQWLMHESRSPITMDDAESMIWEKIAVDFSKSSFIRFGWLRDGVFLRLGAGKIFIRFPESASSLSDLAKPSSRSWPNSCYAV